MEKSIKKFWNSLDYWEAINLLATIIKSTQPTKSNDEVYSDAVAIFSDEDKAIYLIDQSIHTGIH